MSLKKAWAKLVDGTKAFSIAHVQSVFYNYASNVLLKDKLDDMDRIIDEKIAKAMMANQQVNDVDRVPTSALAYSMQQSIEQNKNGITQLNSNLNTLLSGVGKIKFGTTVVSLSEETVFDIDAPGITGNASIAINGDGEAAKGISVIAVREDPENQKLKIYLSGSKTGAMRINYLYKSQ